MSLNLSFGGYSHAVGEAGLTIEKQTVYNEADEALGILERWSYEGMIVGTGQADIDTKSAALEAAYQTNGKDLKLVGSSNQILTASTIGGTRVVSFAWQDNEQAAFTNWRKYTAIVEGLKAATGSTTALVTFAESIARRGGGRMTGFLEPLQGTPIKQTWKQNTVYRVTQQGRAIGFRRYPRFPAPIWPAALVEALSETNQENPQRHKSGSAAAAFTHYPINWTYQFESSTPLLGNPGVWGTV